MLLHFLTNTRTDEHHVPMLPEGVERQRVSGRRVRMRPHDRAPIEIRSLHRDVERARAKSLGARSLQGNLLFVTLKAPSPQAITNPSNSGCRGTWFLRLQLRLLDFDGGADLHPLGLQVSRISLKVRAPRRKPAVVRIAGKFRFEQRALCGDR